MYETRQVAAQERWLDPDCEYARPIDPSSTHVPIGPAGHVWSWLSSERGLDKPVGPFRDCQLHPEWHEGVPWLQTRTHSRGSGVRTPGTYSASSSKPCIGLSYSCISCDSKPGKSGAAMHRAILCTCAAWGKAVEADSLLQSALALLGPVHTSPHELTELSFCKTSLSC